MPLTAEDLSQAEKLLARMERSAGVMKYFRWFLLGAGIAMLLAGVQQMTSVKDFFSKPPQAKVIAAPATQSAMSDLERLERRVTIYENVSAEGQASLRWELQGFQMLAATTTTFLILCACGGICLAGFAVDLVKRKPRAILIRIVRSHLESVAAVANPKKSQA